MPESDIEDLRGDAKKRPMPVADSRVDIEVSDKVLIDDVEDGEGDIGLEMQPAMRGYGKVEKPLRQWKVR